MSILDEIVKFQMKMFRLVSVTEKMELSLSWT